MTASTDTFTSDLALAKLWGGNLSSTSAAWSLVGAGSWRGPLTQFQRPLLPVLR